MAVCSEVIARFLCKICDIFRSSENNLGEIGADTTPDFSEMNGDLIASIASHFEDIEYLEKCRVLCKNWNQIILEGEYCNLLPFFVMYQPNRKVPFNTLIFSFLTAQVKAIFVPEYVPNPNKSLVNHDPSSFIVTRDDNYWITGLIKTINGFHFPIPQIKFLNPSYPIYVDLNPIQNQNRTKNKISNMGIVYEDMRDDDILHIALFDFNSLEMIRLITIPKAPVVSFFKGKIFSSLNYNTRVYDINGGEMQVISHDEIFDDMVRVFDDLFGVVQLDIDGKIHFRIYKLTNNVWVEKPDDIDECMLFVDFHKCICLKGSDFAEFRGENCIYYAKRIVNFEGEKFRVCRYNYKSKETEVLLEKAGFVPGMWCIPSP